MLQKKLIKKADTWLCLRFPYLVLNTVGVRFNCEHAVVALEKQKIIQTNLLAQQLNIRISETIEHARMLSSSLKTVERQVELEFEKLQTLSTWAYRYTSHISVYDDHTLLLEIGRSLDFFNGASSLQNLVLADLERLGLDVKCGVADTPKAAHLLSFNQQHLSQPNFSPQKEWQLSDYKKSIEQSRLKYLAVSEKTLMQLHRCGFDILKDISAIPKAQLGTRFGKPFILYLEQLMGNTPDPQTLHNTPETFKSNIHFAEPIHNRIWIQQQIDRLLIDLIAFINSRQLICRSLTWRFFNEQNGLADSITINFNISTTKLCNLQELTELKLSALSLKWAFSSIELSSKELLPKHLFHQDLFSPTADQEEFNQLVNKLSSRLGNNAIYKLDISNEYLPELANVRCYFAAQPTPTKKKQKPIKYINEHAPKTNTYQQDEPVWLLRQPQRLNKKYGQPEHNGELKVIHGPDRISSHWWHALQSRDYYIARQKTGRLLWIYYERSQKNWYLHGLYA